MPPFKFIHTSDLHLGKQFGSMPQELRGRLIEARHEILNELVAAARDHGASHILVAGDTFDTSSPSDGVRRQAVTAMSAAVDIQWWIIPGNHDSLQGEELWLHIEQDAGQNVHVLTKPEPVLIADGVQLLPAPLTNRFPNEDLTAWMSQTSSHEGQLRIGLAHGGVASFGENSDSKAVISPDRAQSAKLDYLAMGDWHGELPINERTWYSGSPERDRFRHSGRGVCLAVTLSAPGDRPEVSEVSVGRFDWASHQLALSPTSDVLSEFNALLDPDKAARRNVLMQIDVSGFLRMPERGLLEEAAAKVEPDFAFFNIRSDALSTEYEAEDLDLISQGGALRSAADALHAQIVSEGSSMQEKDIAQAALNRLWTIVREDQS